MTKTGAQKVAKSAARLGRAVTSLELESSVDNELAPYAWFISYAKGEDGSSPVAVAVVVEDNQAERDDISGGGLAAPIAKDVMKAVLDSK